MDEIWLVGAGYMAKQYAKVLVGLKRQFTVIGRGKETAAEFEKAMKIPVTAGGIAKYMESNRSPPKFAVVAVDAQYLFETARSLLNYGIEAILLEKPGSLTIKDIAELQRLATEKKVEVFIAYNRRFYASVLKAKEIIKEDSGCTSFIFEFTEWSHEVKDSNKSSEEKAKWFVANSTHVVDLAFYLGGFPKTIECFSSGGLDWHPSASIFSGSGISDSGALFSYCANWEAPGRWGVEVLTRKHRLILRPLEALQVQDLGSLEVRKVVLDDELDRSYKPGLYRETESFLTGASDDLKPLVDQVRDMKLYYKMANYTS
jgi:predicted dehydrogenase